MPTTPHDPDRFIREMRAKGFEINEPGAVVVPQTHTARQFPKHGRPSKPAGVATAAPRRLLIEVDVPIRLKSEANAGGKVGPMVARKAAVKLAVNESIPPLPDPFPFPVVVTMTRMGGNPLDEDDNLPRALKAVKDVIAMRLGVQDTGRDPRVKWVFRQRPAWVPCCRIRIESKGA